MTRTGAIRRLAETLPAALAPFMVEHGRCIAATRVGVAALARFGIEAEPLAVDTRVFNRAAVQWLEDGAPGGGREFERRGGYLLSTFDAEREACAAAGTALPPTRPIPSRSWNGHLIAHVPALRLVVDFDARQMARPEREIVVPDALVVPWNGDEQAITLPSGVVVFYKVRRDASGAMDRTWLESPDWRRDVAPLVARVVRAARRSA